MNRIRRIAITFLIVIAVAGIIHFTSNTTTREPAAIKGVEVAPSADGPEMRAAVPEPAQIKKILTVYCFAGKNYESFVRETVERDFAVWLKSGAVTIKVIDPGSAEKQLLMEEFKIAAPAIVLAAGGGKTAVWQKLDKAGELVADKNAFLNYIRDNIRSFMEKNIQ